MFVKIFIVLLLLIGLASLLRGAPPPAKRLPVRGRTGGARAIMLRIAIVLLALGLTVLALHLGGCSRPPPGFHAKDITGADFGRLATLDGLTDQKGRRIATADFVGKVVVVFFGYTHCPDVCPTTLAMMQETLRLLRNEADRVQVLFVTLDPERDTQAVLQGYLSGFDARFLGLRGNAESIRAVAQAFRVFYLKVPASDALGYTLDHSTKSYVFDPQGRIRLQVEHGASARLLADDLRALLAGK